MKDQFSEFESWLKRNSRKITCIIFFIAIIIGLVPNLIRFQNGSELPGNQAYAHGYFIEGDSKTLVKQSFYFNTPYDYLIYYVGKYLGHEYASMLLSIFFSLIVLFFFDTIMKEMAVNRIKRIISATLLVVSPIFVYLSAYSTPYSMLIALDLILFYIYLKDLKENNILLKITFLIVFFLLLFFNWLNIMIVLIVIYSHKFIYSRTRLNYLFYFLPLLMSIIALFFLKTPFYFTYETLLSSVYYQNLLTEFGSLIGFSVFILILFFIALFYQEDTKAHLISLYIMILLIIGTVFISQELNIYLNFIIVFYASSFIEKLIKRKYRVEFLKEMTILLIFCGLIFSLISFEVLTVKQFPDKNTIFCLKSIKSEKDGLVFANPINSFLIARYANKTTMTDSYSKSDEFNKNIFFDMNFTLYNSDLNEFRKMQNKYNISYIFIDDKSRAEIWENDNQGLLFLLRNSEIFKKVCAGKNNLEKLGIELFKIDEKGLNK